MGQVVIGVVKIQAVVLAILLLVGEARYCGILRSEGFWDLVRMGGRLVQSGGRRRRRVCFSLSEKGARRPWLCRSSWLVLR